MDAAILKHLSNVCSRAKLRRTGHKQLLLGYQGEIILFESISPLIKAPNLIVETDVKNKKRIGTLKSQR